MESILPDLPPLPRRRITLPLSTLAEVARDVCDGYDPPATNLLWISLTCCLRKYGAGTVRCDVRRLVAIGVARRDGVLVPFQADAR